MCAVVFHAFHFSMDDESQASEQMCANRYAFFAQNQKKLEKKVNKNFPTATRTHIYTRRENRCTQIERERGTEWAHKKSFCCCIRHSPFSCFITRSLLKLTWSHIIYRLWKRFASCFTISLDNFHLCLCRSVCVFVYCVVELWNNSKWQFFCAFFPLCLFFSFSNMITCHFQK